MEFTIENCVPSDQILVDEARAGDNEACGRLMQRHYGACLKLANGILHERSDAQDAVHEAIAKALTHLGQFCGQGPFVYWLLRIVTRECLAILRNRRRVKWVYLDRGRGSHERQQPFQLCSAEAGPEREALYHERHDIFDRELRSLPTLFRTAVVLRDVNELSMNKIAEHLGITVAAAKSRLNRARVELGERLTARYGKNSDQRHSIPAFRSVSEPRPLASGFRA